MRAAAILAGGLSRRFGGCDKGSLLVEGRSIRDRQLAELARVADEILLVGGPANPECGAVRVVADRIPGCGPLGGLYTALLEARDEAIVVVACDMPYVCAPLLGYLLALTAEADAVVPGTERGYHPLCAAYTRGCLEPIARRVAGRHLRVTDLLEDLRVRVVTGDEIDRFGEHRRLLANVNTPGEYRELARFQALDHQL